MNKNRAIVMLDALGLAPAIRSKQVSCADVMEAYLDQLSAQDNKGNFRRGSLAGRLFRRAF